jgi:hypothetical protein
MCSAVSAAGDDESARLLRDADDTGLVLAGLWKHEGNAVAA